MVGCVEVEVEAGSVVDVGRSEVERLGDVGGSSVREVELAESGELVVDCMADLSFEMEYRDGVRGSATESPCLSARCSWKASKVQTTF